MLGAVQGAAHRPEAATGCRTGAPTCAAVRDTTMVSPPPGASSAASGRPIAAGGPAGGGRPRPPPRARAAAGAGRPGPPPRAGGCVTEALERGEHPVPVGYGDARAAVHDPQL